ncbi:glycosyltransferase [Sediminitomix flava]|nr:glycosyltransferase [Sediminitomix flava]
MRVIARLNVGGPAIHTILLTDGMNNDTFETMLVSGREAEQEGNMHYLAREKNVDINHFPHLQRELSPMKDAKAFWEMVKLIRQFNPDIIHTHTAKAGFIGRAAAIYLNTFRSAENKIKIVHTFHGHVFHSYFSTLKTNLFINIERFLGKFSDIIITITPKQQIEIKDFGIGTQINHQIVPLGLDLRKFKEKPRMPKSLHQQYNIPEDRILIGTVARFTAIKNLSLFLEIAAKLIERNDKLHFMMVGDGEDREMLEAKAAELGISDSVTFTGFLSDLPSVFADLSILLLTSKNEGSPVSIIEAMTSGTGVVASNVGGVPDLFTEEGKYFLCEPTNIDDYVEKTEKLLTDQEFYNHITTVQQDFIYNKFNIDRLIQDLSVTYQNLFS